MTSPASHRLPLVLCLALSCLALSALISPTLALTAQQAPPVAKESRSSDQARDASTGPAGAWDGFIDLPSGPLDVRVELAATESGWTGTIDIPQQGAKGLTLDPVEVDGATIRFTIVGVPGEPTFRGTLDGDSLSGSFTQGPAQLRFSLTRTDRPAPALRRPQTPTPPFPYRSEEVTVPSGDPAAGGVTLAGTLTLPAGEGPFPGLVLLTGSGPQDRDETLFGHKPFLVIADHLGRRGIAVLRLDDRGVGGSTGSLASTSLADLARDARAAVGFLGSRPEIAADRVGLLGHSEGGVVAPLAATLDDAQEDEPAPAYLVLLASPGVPGRELLQEQLGVLGRAQGVPEPLGDVFDAMVAAGVDSILEGTSEEALREHLTAVGGERLGDRPESARAVVSQLAHGLAAQLDALQTPLLRDFLRHDPRRPLRQVRMPVLALNGGLDLQVDAERNLRALGEALTAAGNESVTLRTLPGLNHLFQRATSGNPAEYGQIEQTIAPEVLDLLAEWIEETLGAAATEPSP